MKFVTENLSTPEDFSSCSLKFNRRWMLVQQFFLGKHIGMMYKRGS